MFSLKINKRGGLNKVRGDRKKIEKLISGGEGGTFTRHVRVPIHSASSQLTLICDQSRVQSLQLMSIRIERIMALILKQCNEFLKIIEISQFSTLAKFCVLITSPVLSLCQLTKGIIACSYVHTADPQYPYIFCKAATTSQPSTTFMCLHHYLFNG